MSEKKSITVKVFIEAEPIIQLSEVAAIASPEELNSGLWLVMQDK